MNASITRRFGSVAAATGAAALTVVLGCPAALADNPSGGPTYDPEQISSGVPGGRWTPVTVVHDAPPGPSSFHYEDAVLGAATGALVVGGAVVAVSLRRRTSLT
ncbi:hypothetical protein FB382_000067 [Nocardioides ginsengisegetis]|uniref:Cobalt/nickel transport protein n=1 Tax=Nocardioides ginsengisegetis TaxID=661491 RepID=A0A7W3P7X6_9ACTN|nr:hypothetical protein [Nocardioides ginsengisegetis]MBA8801776.1 hypothetical protein [Nocardioides ginsengisegetis]